MSEITSKPVELQDIEALEREINYAWTKWGGEFDAKNTLNDWITYAMMYASDAAKMEFKGDAEATRGFLIKAAGLLMNAAARVRLNTVADRHYENEFFPNHVHGTGRAFLR